MATTLVVNSGSKFYDGSQLLSQLVPPQCSLTLSAKQYFAGVLTIGTSEEDITFTDITTPRVVTMYNLDGTNYVSWGPKSGGAMVLCGTLYPQSSSIGVAAQFELGASVTIRMAANTAACQVAFFVSGS